MKGLDTFDIIIPIELSKYMCSYVTFIMLKYKIQNYVCVFPI